MRDALAIAVARSANEKIGDCATTYAAQASCPTSCVFFNGGGCYAENGRIYTSTTVHLNDAAASSSATAIDVAKAEADAISHLPVLACDERPLRLHTVGDCRTDEAARIVAAAAEEYMRRGGGPVWTYTHAWRTVDRASWGAVSVLASCETPEQVELAHARGYATSMVVEEFRSRRLHDTREAPDGSSADDRAVARGDRRGEAVDRQRHRGGRRDDPGARGPAQAGDVEAGGREGARGAARIDAAGHAVASDVAATAGGLKIGGGGAPAHTEAPPPSSCRTAPVSRSSRSGDTGSPGRRVKGERPGSAGAPVTSARILPCPAQTTEHVTCSSCRLCMDDSRLRDADGEPGESGGGRRVAGGAGAWADAQERDGDRHVRPAERGQALEVAPDAASVGRERWPSGDDSDAQPRQAAERSEGDVAVADGGGDAWGAYGDAVRRWERVLGRTAPAPTDDRGRLNARFVEWMLGFPDGWVDVTGVSRTQQLRMLGNAVQVQCGTAVGRYILDQYAREGAAA